MLLTFPRASLPAGLAVISCLFLVYLYFNASALNGSTTSQGFSINPQQQRLPIQCPPTSSTSNIVLSVKTGATEAFEKLPTQLLTLWQCAPNLVFFSDLEQDIGPYHIHDVLSRYDPAIVSTHPDFELYLKQKEYQSQGRDIRGLSKMQDSNAGWRTAGHNAAWALDKYKFLHMIERAWELQPDKDWYVFAETDTYIVWRNLVPWLQQYDPNEAIYLGRGEPMMKEEGEGFYFAHGGTGFVLSRAAMRDFCVTHKGLASRWDNRIADLWFGDYVVAKALKEELGLNLTSATPEFSGDKPMSLPFGAGIWCKPIITQHHLRPEEVQGLWMLEDKFYNSFASHSTPRLVYSDLFKSLLTGVEFPDRRDAWDNLSNDNLYALEKPRSKVQVKEKPSSQPNEPAVDKDPNSSPDACAAACGVLDKCFQWSHLKFRVIEAKKEIGGGLCYLSSVFRSGKERPKESWVDDKNATNVHVWTSGWREGTIRDWLAKQPEDCGEVDW